MNKDKNKVVEKPKVDPLGDMRIAESRGRQLSFNFNILTLFIGNIERLKRLTSELILKIRSNTDAAEN